MKAIREVYGEVLVELAKDNDKIMVLDADLSGSTKSGKFGKEYPERFSTWVSPRAIWSPPLPAWRAAA